MIAAKILGKNSGEVVSPFSFAHKFAHFHYIYRGGGLFVDLAILRAGALCGRALCGRICGAWRGGVIVYRGGAWRDTCGAYIWRYICASVVGRFFVGYYMADFTGVNGGFFEKVSKSTRQLFYFPVY